MIPRYCLNVASSSSVQCSRESSSAVADPEVGEFSRARPRFSGTKDSNFDRLGDEMNMNIMILDSSKTFH